MLLPQAPPQDLGLDARQLQIAYDQLEQWTREGSVPGGAILVGREGQTVEPRFFGRQGPEPNAEVLRRDAMFLMASITKPMVYMGAMILVERGLLGLSDLVTHYLPDFAAHHKEETRVHHLFTHTSGLPDMLPNNAELRAQHAPLSEFTRAAIRDTVPLFRPGADLSYQSMGTLVMAELIQQVSKLSISEFLQREIIQPLGLESTGLGSQGFDRARLVRVQVPEYQATGDFGWNSVYWQQLGAPWGGLFSTPEDFAVICQLLLNGGEYNGKRLLASRTVELMTTNRLNDYPDLPEPIRRTQPWGLGWRLNHLGLEDSWGDLLDRDVFGHTDRPARWSGWIGDARASASC